jgi:hypothetical protein
MVFIVREIWLGDDLLSTRIDEEAVFTSHDKAEKFISELVDHDADWKRLLAFRIEVLEIPVDNMDPDDETKRWVYGIDGKLLEEPNVDIYSKAKNNIENKYKVGDIVYIKPNYVETMSPSVRGDYGVVLVTPIKKKDWIAQGNDLEDWDWTYVIVFVTVDGFLDHMHVSEAALSLVNGSLPEELSFLEIYSSYLKGDISISDSVINRLFKEEIFVKNSRVLEFDNIQDVYIKEQKPQKKIE